VKRPFGTESCSSDATSRSYERLGSLALIGLMYGSGVARLMPWHPDLVSN
jgi:hypothetical protein